MHELGSYSERHSYDFSFLVQSFGWIRTADPDEVDARVPIPAGLIAGVFRYKKPVQQTQMIPFEDFVHDTQCLSQLSSCAVGQKARHAWPLVVTLNSYQSLMLLT